MMLNSQTIKNKLIGLTLLGLLTSAVVGIYSYKTVEKINSAMGGVAASSTILRNHMYADMMHDALNSDVHAAILASEGIRGIDATAVDSELKEHAESFTQALGKNEKLITDLNTRAALQKALPALHDYIAAASKIVLTAKTDRQAAVNSMDEFHKAFSALETEMENLTQLIEANVAATQARAESERSHSTKIVLSISAVGAIVMVIISFLVITNITVPLELLVRTSDQVAMGELTVRFDNSRTDEIGRLSSAMEKMRINLVSVISQIGVTTTKLSESVKNISTVTRDVSDRMTQQHAETEQVAAAMNEMTSTVHEVSNNIMATDNSAQQAATETEMGSQVVSEAVMSIKVLANQIGEAAEIINRVEQNTHNISTVLDVIRNIAEQTNLLALNAAIEAARAGEQGRGFAVVADEVRTLASRTQQSTGEINEMINQLQQGSKLSVDAMSKSCEQAGLVVNKAEHAGRSLTTIATTVQKISDLSAQIATAAEEQTAVSDEINRNVVHINQATLYTSENAKKTSDIADHLARVTVDLQQLVGQFKV